METTAPLVYAPSLLDQPYNQEEAQPTLLEHVNGHGKE